VKGGKGVVTKVFLKASFRCLSKNVLREWGGRFLGGKEVRPGEEQKSTWNRGKRKLPDLEPVRIAPDSSKKGKGGGQRGLTETTTPHSSKGQPTQNGGKGGGEEDGAGILSQLRKGYYEGQKKQTCRQRTVPGDITKENIPFCREKSLATKAWKKKKRGGAPIGTEETPPPKF